jgi:hypothetical protein
MVTRVDPRRCWPGRLGILRLLMPAHAAMTATLLEGTVDARE